MQAHPSVKYEGNCRQINMWGDHLRLSDEWTVFAAHTHTHTHTHVCVCTRARTHTHTHTHICCQMHLISCACDCKAWHCEHDPHIGHNTWERLLFGNNTPCSTSLTWHRDGFIMPETRQGPPQMGKTLSIFRICLQPSSQNNYCDLVMQVFSTRYCLSTVSL